MRSARNRRSGETRRTGPRQGGHIQMGPLVDTGMSGFSVPAVTGGVDTELKRGSVAGIPFPMPVSMLPDATPDEEWRKSAGHTYADPLV